MLPSYGRIKEFKRRSTKTTPVYDVNSATSAIGMMGLGKIKNPATDKIERDLGSAKYAIDTLNALAEYTEGNLPRELKSYLDQSLTTLRLNYADEVKKGESSSKTAEGDGQSSEAKED